MFFFMTTNKKRQCYPLCFFSSRPIKNDTVTPCVLFMTTNEKQQCYPLCFFPCRPIKNNSVTPYVLFHDDQRKETVLTPIFYLINVDSVTICIYFMTADKKRQSYPLCFFSWRPIKNNSVAPYVFFHVDQRKNSVTPYVFFDDGR